MIIRFYSKIVFKFQTIGSSVAGGRGAFPLPQFCHATSCASTNRILGINKIVHKHTFYIDLNIATDCQQSVSGAKIHQKLSKTGLLFWQGASHMSILMTYENISGEFIYGIILQISVLQGLETMPAIHPPHFTFAFPDVLSIPPVLC